MNLKDVGRLAADLKSSGLVSTTISLTEPTLSVSDDFSKEEITDDFIFESFVNEKEIYDVSRDLFISQFYNNAVQEAFNALDKYVQMESGISESSGASLMRVVFNPKNPLLALNSNKSQSEKDEAEGYSHLFAGAMLGIRNPVTHEFQWIDNRETALECLIFCQHLLRKAKAAANS